jgi:hypothetical protein
VDVNTSAIAAHEASQSRLLEFEQSLQLIQACSTLLNSLSCGSSYELRNLTGRSTSLQGYIAILNQQVQLENEKAAEFAALIEEFEAPSLPESATKSTSSLHTALSQAKAELAQHNRVVIAHNTSLKRLDDLRTNLEIELRRPLVAMKLEEEAEVQRLGVVIVEAAKAYADYVVKAGLS